MERRIFLRLDEDSLSEEIIAKIKDHDAVTILEQDILCFTFDDIEFQHASLLLGSNPDRFDSDLSLYLETVNLFFRRRTANFIVFDVGNANAKKRLSEDLGVGMASILLSKILSVKWETITHISPTSKRKSPDFICFDTSGSKYIYEAKGTTRADEVEKCRSKAKEQLNSYSDESKSGFAVVTYFANSSKYMPSFSFLSDPPLRLPKPIDEHLSKAMHFMLISEFVGMKKLVDVLPQYIKAEHDYENLTNDLYYSKRQKIEEAYELQLSALKSIYDEEFQDKKEIKFQDRIFVGKQKDVEVSKQKCKLFMGIDKEYFRRSLFTEESEWFPKNECGHDDNTVFSVFSDGTLLLMYL